MGKSVADLLAEMRNNPQPVQSNSTQTFQPTPSGGKSSAQLLSEIQGKPQPATPTPLNPTKGTNLLPGLNPVKPNAFAPYMPTKEELKAITPKQTIGTNYGDKGTFEARLKNSQNASKEKVQYLDKKRVLGLQESGRKLGHAIVGGVSSLLKGIDTTSPQNPITNALDSFDKKYYSDNQPYSPTVQSAELNKNPNISEQTKKIGDIQFGVGNLTGEMAQQLAPYSIANKVLGGVQVFQKLSPFIKNVVIGQIADTAIQTPSVIARSTSEGKPAQEVLKDVLSDQAINLAFNVGFSGFQNRKAIKEALSNFSAKKITEKELESIVKSESETVIKEVKPDWYADPNGQVTNKIIDQKFGLPAPKTEPMASDTKSSILRLGKIKPSELKHQLVNPISDIKTVAENNLKTAQQNWEDAINDVRNHFMTSDLRVEEYNRIKPELGIDLEKIADEYSKAEYDLSHLDEFAKSEQSRQAYGVLSPEETKYFNQVESRQKILDTINAEKMPQINKVNSEYSKTDIPKDNVFTATPAEIKRVKGAENPPQRMSNSIDTTIPNTDINPSQAIQGGTEGINSNVAKGIDNEQFSLTVKGEPKSKTQNIAQNENLPTSAEIIDTRANVLTKTPNRKVPLKTRAERIYQATFSKNAPLERIGRIKPIENAKQIKYLGNLSGQYGGQVNYNLVNSLTDLKGNEIGKSFVDRIKPINIKDRQAFFNYMFHQHNVSRSALEKPVFGKNVTSEMSIQTVQRIEKAHPEFKAISTDVKDYINKIVDEYGVKTGLVSKDAIEIMREMYPEYVPTYRDIEKVGDSYKGIKSGNIIKKATGSDKPLLPLDQQVAQFTNKFIRAGRKNELYNEIYNAVLENPQVMGKYARVSKEISLEAEQAAKQGIEEVTAYSEKAIEKVGDIYKLNFFKDGKPISMEVSEDMYNTFKSHSPYAIEGIIDIVNKGITKPMKAVITNYNPVFIVSNFMRDLPTALINSISAPRWIKNYPIAIKEMLTNGERFRQFKALGGYDAGFLKVNKDINVPYKGKVDIGKIAKVPLKAVNSVGQSIEILPRFTEYLATLDKYGDTYENRIMAMFNASEITTNFSRGGDVVKEIGKAVPYSNPSFQGVDKFIRQIVRRPLSTIGKGLTVIALPSAIIYYMNKDNPDYQQLSQTVKDNYYNFPMGDGKFFSVPKSRENGVLFSTLFEWVAQSQQGNTPKIGDIFSTINMNVAPVNPFESFAPIPAIKAINQTQNPQNDNRNFANSPIVPQGMRTLEKKYQYDENTSEISKFIGDKLNVQPKVIDFLISSYTGVIGQFYLPSSSKRNPFEAKFIKDPLYQTDAINNFYDRYNKAQTNAKTYNFTQNIPSKQITPQDQIVSNYRRVADLISAKTDEISKLQKQQGTEAQVKKLRQEMIDLANSIKS